MEKVTTKKKSAKKKPITKKRATKPKKPSATKAARAKQPAENPAPITQYSQATQFKPGNEIWRLGLSVRRVYSTPEELLAAACAYFDWAAEQSLNEDQSQFWTKTGTFVRNHKAHARAFTIEGLCLHAGIRRAWFYEVVKTSPEFADTVEWIRSVIWEQKFTLAAAGLLNPGLIARELGLADKQELTGKDGAPVQFADMTDIEIGRRIAFALAQAANVANAG